jgi:hypothetical protein
MQLASEIVYPIYLAGASDRYFHFDYNVQKMVIINNCANHFHYSQESVTKRGDELLKRKASTANLEDPKLIKKLFTLFNGMPYVFYWLPIYVFQLQYTFCGVHKLFHFFGLESD